MLFVSNLLWKYIWPWRNYYYSFSETSEGWWLEGHPVVENLSLRIPVDSCKHSKVGIKTNDNDDGNADANE